MRIHVRHRMTYAYTAPVSLDTQTVRLVPRDDEGHWARSFALTVSPDAAVSGGADAEGNGIRLVTIAAPTSSFDLLAECEVDTSPRTWNPARDAGLDRVPARYIHLHVLTAYRGTRRPPSVVAEYADEVAASAGHETRAALEALAARIYREHRQVTRLHGSPRSPEDTLFRGEGACRDLAVLFLACARHWGLAARFVSGYYVRPENDRGNELHAWGEVFLGSEGWRGFDPSGGGAVTERHVAVAHAARPLGAAPVVGTWKGPAGTQTSLTFDVDVRRADAAVQPGPEPF